jgi:hypothetical protein
MKISHAPPSEKHKNSMDKLLSCPSPIYLVLAFFHPYTYLNYQVNPTFTFLHYQMSSVNLSNESPASSTPSSPTLPIPFNPLVSFTVTPDYTPVSPQTALNILATQPNLNKTVWAIAYGLISTVHKHEVTYALETKECNETNRILQQRLKQYVDKINHNFFLPGCPNGYKENGG